MAEILAATRRASAVPEPTSFPNAACLSQIASISASALFSRSESSAAREFLTTTSRMTAKSFARLSGLGIRPSVEPSEPSRCLCKRRPFDGLRHAANCRSY